jgi:hypothetical protein
MQALGSIGDFSRHKDSSRLHLGLIWLTHFGVLMGFQDFAMHFLDEVLSHDVAHIENFPLLGDVYVTLGILSSCVAR